VGGEEGAAPGRGVREGGGGGGGSYRRRRGGARARAVRGAGARCVRTPYRGSGAVSLGGMKEEQISKVGRDEGRRGIEGPHP